MASAARDPIFFVAGVRLAFAARIQPPSGGFLLSKNVITDKSIVDT
jgi:hypothetical protein